MYWVVFCEATDSMKRYMVHYYWNMLDKVLFLAFIVLTEHMELNEGSLVLLTCFLVR